MKPDRLTLIAFILVVIIGGGNAVAVRFSNAELPPFWGATLRFAAASLVFWSVVSVRRIPIPRGRALQGALLYGFLTIGIYYALLYWALVFIPASLTIVILSISPLLTFFFAWAHKQERFRWQGLLGALIALAGIVLAVGAEIGASLDLLPLLALVAGAAVIAEATVLYKKFPQSDLLMVNALALGMGTIVLAFISRIAGEAWSLPTEQSTWIAYSYLVLAGTVILFYLYLYVLERWTASATSYTFLLFPISTLLLAAWLTDEIISPRFLLGGAIVLLGVWLGAFRQPRK